MIKLPLSQTQTFNFKLWKSIMKILLHVRNYANPNKEWYNISIFIVWEIIYSFIYNLIILYIIFNYVIVLFNWFLYLDILFQKRFTARNTIKRNTTSEMWLKCRDVSEKQNAKNDRIPVMHACILLNTVSRQINYCFTRVYFLKVLIVETRMYANACTHLKMLFLCMCVFRFTASFLFTQCDVTQFTLSPQAHAAGLQ